MQSANSFTEYSGIQTQGNHLPKNSMASCYYIETRARFRDFGLKNGRHPRPLAAPLFAAEKTRASPDRQKSAPSGSSLHKTRIGFSSHRPIAELLTAPFPTADCLRLRCRLVRA